jgi:hypothetical protein
MICNMQDWESDATEEARVVRHHDLAFGSDAGAMEREPHEQGQGDKSGV